MATALEPKRVSEAEKQGSDRAFGDDYAAAGPRPAVAAVPAGFAELLGCAGACHAAAIRNHEEAVLTGSANGIPARDRRFSAHAQEILAYADHSCAAAVRWIDR